MKNTTNKTTTKAAILRVLATQGIENAEAAVRSRLGSDERQHFDAAVDELLDEGAVLTGMVRCPEPFSEPRWVPSIRLPGQERQ